MDTYPMMPNPWATGVQQYKKNGEQADQGEQQGQLLKALLAQSMQSNPGGGALGTASHLLSQYMMMNTLNGMNSRTVNAGGAGGMQSIPDSTYDVNLAMPSYMSPMG